MNALPASRLRMFLTGTRTGRALLRVLHGDARARWHPDTWESIPAWWVILPSRWYWRLLWRLRVWKDRPCAFCGCARARHTSEDEFADDGLCHGRQWDDDLKRWRTCSCSTYELADLKKMKGFDRWRFLRRWRGMRYADV